MEELPLTTANSSSGGEKNMELPISSQGASASSPSNAASTRRRVIQNFRLIWLDPSIDESDEDCARSIAQLRRFVNTINTFTDADQCIDFLTEIKEEKILMIVSGDLGQYLIDLIHDVSQLNSIYVFCANKSIHEPRAKKWSKVKGIFTQIEAICESLKQTTRRCDQNSISVSFISASDVINPSLNQLDQSFMYTQILKEILLEINYNDQSIKELTIYCHNQYAGNEAELTKITKFEQEYHLHSPIWWYTNLCLIYSMLNRALRTQEVDTIIKMGFFIRDLHCNIQKLYSENFDDRRESMFLVYRGQGLSKPDFNKMLKTKGGLMSFNNFLSTSKERDVSYSFAESSAYDPELIGILFEITINTSISSAPFADINDVSYFPSENEILFSMHTIFRIGEIKQIGGNDQLWQVKLTLTNDNDSELAALTERMRQETKGHVGWLRLSKLLVKLGEFDKAEQVYWVVLNETTNDQDRAALYQLLGSIKDDLGDHAEALFFYEIALELYQKILPWTHPDFITTYNNIAAVYFNMGDYSKAFTYCEKLVEVRQKILPSNHPALAASYNNIGFVFFKKKEHSKALYYYEKALAIYQRALPPNHPTLSSSYNNLAGVYNSTGEYSTALSYLEKALEIDQKILPPNHPDLASDYNNIGWVYTNMCNYSKAIPFYERAMEIAHLFNLPSDHPNIRTYRRNLESARKKL